MRHLLWIAALIITGQAWSAELPADPFVTRSVVPGWTLSHFGLGEQRRFERPLVAAFADGNFTLQADSGMLFFKRPDVVKLPVWLKIERQGQTFRSSHSPDGQEWKLLKEMEIPMGSKILHRLGGLESVSPRAVRAGGFGRRASEEGTMTQAGRQISRASVGVFVFASCSACSSGYWPLHCRPLHCRPLHCGRSCWRRHTRSHVFTGGSAVRSETLCCLPWCGQAGGEVRFDGPLPELVEPKLAKQWLAAKRLLAEGEMPPKVEPVRPPPN
jgi:hypothetical protein